jgi:peptidoglycan hydrolase-like protein with peptidoglycan-binding domain
MGGTRRQHSDDAQMGGTRVPASEIDHFKESLMKLKQGMLALAAAGAFAVTPAMAQQGAGASADQVLQQEQAQGSGAQLQLSPSTVRQIQQALNQAGYSVGNVDGVWGPQTAQALQNYQQAQGLEPTGQLNQRTLAQLGVQGQGAAVGGDVGAGAGVQAGGAASGSDQIITNEQ